MCALNQRKKTISQKYKVFYTPTGRIIRVLLYYLLSIINGVLNIKIAYRLYITIIFIYKCIKTNVEWQSIKCIS